MISVGILKCFADIVNFGFLDFVFGRFALGCWLGLLISQIKIVFCHANDQNWSEFVNLGSKSHPSHQLSAF